jgi:hypothetical protein
MCLGLFGMLVAVSRAFCDMQARAEYAEALANSLATLTTENSVRRVSMCVPSETTTPIPEWAKDDLPQGWFGRHES